jgi:hypothetical protein
MMSQEFPAKLTLTDRLVETTFLKNEINGAITARVARFFLMQHTKTEKYIYQNIPKCNT